MEDVYIVAAGRSAVGAFMGSLSTLPASEIAAQVIKGTLEKYSINATDIDEVILGQVLTAGNGMNPARQSMIFAGIPEEVPAMTINQVCGSGLRTVDLGMRTIKAGDADMVLVGGQENMSQSPHLVKNSRNGQRMGDWKMEDSMIKDGLWDHFNNYHMGITAENIVDQYKFSREAQDEFAAASQAKATAAIEAGKFADEIIPVTIPQRRKDDIVFDTDENPRATTAEKLSGLRPAFSKEGSVTAGNASSINDGAAILVLASGKKVKELGLEPIAKCVAFASCGVDPKIMGTGPIPTTQKCLEKAGWTVDDLERIEANEAFAAQAMSVNADLGWDTDKVNVNGGAIAIGHPIGASGARILVTLLNGMKADNQKKGLATLCVGGGMGVSLAVERV